MYCLGSATLGPEIIATVAVVIAAAMNWKDLRIGSSAVFGRALHKSRAATAVCVPAAEATEICYAAAI
jgi:hypothetical protein